MMDDIITTLNELSVQCNMHSDRMMEAANEPGLGVSAKGERVNQSLLFTGIALILARTAMALKK